MPTGLQSAFQYINIARAILFVDKEMQRRSIMPEQPRARRPKCRHIGHHPFDLTCACSKSFLRLFKRFAGNIENRNVRKAVVKQVINKCRCSAAYVDYRVTAINGSLFDELQRPRWSWLKPRNIGKRL
jgi:hypothetical protein